MTCLLESEVVVVIESLDDDNVINEEGVVDFPEDPSRHVEDTCVEEEESLRKKVRMEEDEEEEGGVL